MKKIQTLLCCLFATLMLSCTTNKVDSLINQYEDLAKAQLAYLESLEAEDFNTEEFNNKVNMFAEKQSKIEEELAKLESEITPEQRERLERISDESADKATEITFEKLGGMLNELGGAFSDELNDFSQDIDEAMENYSKDLQENADELSRELEDTSKEVEDLFN